MSRLAGLIGYAAPGWAPVPVAYPAPPPLPSRTERGIGYARWAVVVGLAMQGLALSLTAYAAILVSALLGNPPSLDAAFLSLLGTMIGLTCAIGLVGLVGGILFLIGLYYLHAGRDEYGPAHTQSMDRVLIYAIIALVFAITAPIGGTFTSAFIGFGAGFGMFGTTNVVSGTLGAVRGLFAGLALATALRAFQTEDDRRVGLASAALLAVAPAGAAVVGVLFPVSPGLTDSRILLTVLPIWLGAAAVAAAIELIAYVLFFRLYSKTSRQMHAGEFAGMYRPPPMFVPYYPAPVSYYYPPYPAYPPPQPAPPPAPPPTPPPQKPPEGPPRT